MVKPKLKPYLRRGYPILLAQLSQLVRLSVQDPNIGALVLYGSIARLTPHWSSDVDVLLLCQKPQAFIWAGEASQQGMYLIVEVTSPEEEWSLAPQVTDLAASDLSPTLLANIAHDGVLLYQRAGTTLPPAMVGLLPYERWMERVQRRLGAPLAMP